MHFVTYASLVQGRGTKARFLQEAMDFQTKLSEAKDQLAHINSSIDATRNKVFLLITICFSLVAYFSTEFFAKPGETNQTKLNMFYASLGLSVVIVLVCTVALNPIKLRFNGISPDGLKRIAETHNKEEYIENSILHTYQSSITINGSHLTRMAKAYNRAFLITCIWLLCCSGFLIIERLVG